MHLHSWSQDHAAPVQQETQEVIAKAERKAEQARARAATVAAAAAAAAAESDEDEGDKPMGRRQRRKVKQEGRSYARLANRHESQGNAVLDNASGGNGANGGKSGAQVGYCDFTQLNRSSCVSLALFYLSLKQTFIK